MDGWMDACTLVCEIDGKAVQERVAEGNESGNGASVVFRISDESSSSVFPLLKLLCPSLSHLSLRLLLLCLSLSLCLSVSLCVCLSLSISLTHTHPHTHTHFLCCYLSFLCPSNFDSVGHHYNHLPQNFHLP